MAYRLHDRNKTKNVHHGQRKLLLVEILFLSQVVKKIGFIPFDVVYAGSSPGYHLDILVEMFPTGHFICWDPAVLRATNERIEFHQDFFSDTVAKKYGKKSRNRPLLFICDIRTGGEDTAEQNFMSRVPPAEQAAYRGKSLNFFYDQEVWRNMEQQASWVRLMKPEFSFLKFRLPYEAESLGETVKYFQGELFWQPWAPKGSSEMRLMFEGVPLEILYNVPYFDSLAFTHNQERTSIHYQSPSKDYPNKMIDPPELLDDFDSAAEAMIYLYYVTVHFPHLSSPLLRPFLDFLFFEQEELVQDISDLLSLSGVRALSRYVTTHVGGDRNKVFLSTLRDNQLSTKLLRSQGIRLEED